MTDLTYDPDFPYVVLIREDHRPDCILGKFSDIAYANQLKNAGIAAFREVVDTTPKPKIPEDAEYIFVTSEDNEPDFAHQYGDQWYWHTTGEFIDFRDLLEYIGSSEVTVLVRKEEM